MDDDLGIALFQETSIVITCCFHFLGVLFAETCRNMPKHEKKIGVFDLKPIIIQ
jgi:hypothetical protein